MPPLKRAATAKDAAKVENDLAKLPGVGPAGRSPVIIGQGDDAVTGDRLLVYGTEKALK